MPVLAFGLSLTSSDSTIVEIRDTTADGRAFYAAEVFDEDEGILFQTNMIGVQVFREVNAKRIKAERERDIADAQRAEAKIQLSACEKQKESLQKDKVDLELKEEKTRELYTKEQDKGVNKDLIIKDLQKKLAPGKIMTIVGSVGVGVGVAGILYGLLK